MDSLSLWRGGCRFVFRVGGRGRCGGLIPVHRSAIFVGDFVWYWSVWRSNECYAEGEGFAGGGDDVDVADVAAGYDVGSE